EPKDLVPLLDTIIEAIPAPEVIPDHPLQMLVLALYYDQYKGQMGIGKILAGSVEKGQPIVQLKPGQEPISGKVTALTEFEGLQRKDVEKADAGDIVAIAGLPDIKIGDTIADPADPIALPAVKIDEPTVRMTFGVNTSPFSGIDGTHVTSQRLKERLWKEMETNVALRVEETDSRDTFLVSGRGELHLAILIETMRREGYEMQVSQPVVILKEEGETLMEPYEHLSIDVPSDYQGVIMEELGTRGAELLNMAPVGVSEIHMEYSIPTRGVIGLKTELMTSTHGHVIMHHVFDVYKAVNGPVTMGIPHGSLMASVPGSSTGYALDNAQERGALFIGPGVEVYMGMVIGQNARDQDMDINVCKTKNLTNMRSSGADAAINLTPPRPVTLEYAMEYIGEDELVEVTPKYIRLRKKILDASRRKRPVRG
ncbi:MAG: translational GTPase TypA, partial [Candidatus Latescibacteria bacterium]|nr:translational GTPase TypA [Candidatus Latescibacterota bacterium]